MTFEEIQKAISEIDRLKDSDPEAAASLRDSLYENTLSGIAEFDADPQGLAAEALKASKIKLKWEARG